MTHFIRTEYGKVQEGYDGQENAPSQGACQTKGSFLVAFNI